MRNGHATFHNVHSERGEVASAHVALPHEAGPRSDQAQTSRFNGPVKPTHERTLGLGKISAALGLLHAYPRKVGRLVALLREAVHSLDGAQPLRGEAGRLDALLVTGEPRRLDLLVLLRAGDRHHWHEDHRHASELSEHHAAAGDTEDHAGARHQGRRVAEHVAHALGHGLLHLLDVVDERVDEACALAPVEERALLGHQRREKRHA
mmetsp:Transcript_97786/g.279654  ORF Transcript_97786/g.279654 Transcript_97786/m.279654 type:complete len:207 (+) Transcript_97786:98-718(+)